MWNCYRRGHAALEDTEKCVPRALESGLALERQYYPRWMKYLSIEASFCFLGVQYHDDVRYIKPAKSNARRAFADHGAYCVSISQATLRSRNKAVTNRLIPALFSSDPQEPSGASTTSFRVDQSEPLEMQKVVTQSAVSRRTWELLASGSQFGLNVFDSRQGVRKLPVSILAQSVRVFGASILR